MTNIETIVHGNISFALKWLIIYKIHIGKLEIVMYFRYFVLVNTYSDVIHITVFKE